MTMPHQHNMLSGIVKTSKIKQMQESSEVMEKENFEIEVKIHELKERMKKEKEERERMGGPRWQSSRKNAPQKVVTTNKKRTIRVLKEQTVDKYYTRKPTTRYRNDSTQSCGQCEKKQAKVRCNECGEVYCTGCYKDFHTRGALRKHTWQTIDQEIKSNHSAENTSFQRSPGDNVTNGKTKYREVYRNQQARDINGSYGESISFSDALAQCDSQIHGRINGFTSSQPVNSNSLLQGAYDEDKNARDFAQALAEWRMSGKSSTSKSTDVGTEVSEKPSVQINVNVPTTSNLTYLDRIMVKHHKKNPNTFHLKSDQPNQGISDSVPSKKNESQLHISISPNQSQSPCVLSLHFSEKPDKREPVNPTVEIIPCDDQSDYSEIEADDIIPIIFTDESTDNDEIEYRSKSSMRERISELDLANQQQVLVNVEDVSQGGEFKPKVSKAPKKRHLKNQAFSPLIESPEQLTWSASTTYESMGKFFLIGATPCGDEKRETYELTANNDAGDFIVRNSKGSWLPAESTVKDSKDTSDVGSLQRKISGVQKLAVYRDVSRKPSCDVAKFNMDNYDYMQALPPLIKGDNYEKVHRASTSLSIGTTPFDIWQDNDSSPSSRRPSHFLNNQTNRRDTSTEKNNSNKEMGSGPINFENIDRLAEKIAEANLSED